MTQSVIELSKEKQVILETLHYLGVENIFVREDGGIIINRSLKGGLNGIVLGKSPSGKIDEKYLFPELLQLEGHNCLVVADLVNNYCTDLG